MLKPLDIVTSFYFTLWIYHSSAPNPNLTIYSAKSGAKSFKYFPFTMGQDIKLFQKRMLEQHGRTVFPGCRLLEQTHVSGAGLLHSICLLQPLGFSCITFGFSLSSGSVLWSAQEFKSRFLEQTQLLQHEPPAKWVPFIKRNTCRLHGFSSIW